MSVPVWPGAVDSSGVAQDYRIAPKHCGLPYYRLQHRQEEMNQPRKRLVQTFVQCVGRHICYLSCRRPPSSKTQRHRCSGIHQQHAQQNHRVPELTQRTSNRTRRSRRLLDIFRQKPTDVLPVTVCKHLLAHTVNMPRSDTFLLYIPKVDADGGGPSVAAREPHRRHRPGGQGRRPLRCGCFARTRPWGRALAVCLGSARHPRAQGRRCGRKACRAWGNEGYWRTALGKPAGHLPEASVAQSDTCNLQSKI